MTKKLTAKCPECKEAFDFYTSLARPFCSERCKSIDLGHWFNETYVVPGEKLRMAKNPLELEEDFELGENFSDSQEGYINDEENN